MDGSSSSVMMHSAASAMFQSAMSFLKESTHGSSSTRVERTQRDGTHARRGAALLLRNAELFSASAMCGKVGADLLTVNAEGFDLTRTDADGEGGECVLTSRDHEALTGTPGLTVVHARAPGVGGAVCVSISGAVGKLVRGDGARACRGGEGVLGDIGVTMADISAAMKAADADADADDTPAAADPYYAHLDVRESAVQLVGATKGDADEVTSHRGVLRVDSLRVAVVPGESGGGTDAETTAIPNTHTHPASSGPSLKHSARIEGIAVHVAPLTVNNAATDVDVADLPGFPCTRRALEAANMPAVARESEVRVEAHTGGGRAARVALRSTSLRCDFHGDSLNAAADLLDAMSHHCSSDDSRDEEETRTLSSFESSPPHRRLDNAPAAAAALSPPSVRVAAGHTVLDTVDEAAFLNNGDGSSGRAKSPQFGGVIEDYASVSNGADRKARTDERHAPAILPIHPAEVTAAADHRRAAGRAHHVRVQQVIRGCGIDAHKVRVPRDGRDGGDASDASVPIANVDGPQRRDDGLVHGLACDGLRPSHARQRRATAASASLAETHGRTQGCDASPNQRRRGNQRGP